MSLYLGSDFFQKYLCQSDRVFIFSSSIRDSFVQKNKLHPKTKGEDPDFRHCRIPMPNFFQWQCPKALLTPGHYAKKLCHYSYHCFGS